MNSRKWTRREFGQAAVALAGAFLAARNGFAAPATLQGLAFVGSAPSDQPKGGFIHSFRTVGDRWTALDIQPAAAPAHLLMHPTLPVLYAVHNVDTWDHLPRGAVSAYRVDLDTGRLDHLRSQPLSLAATHPRHAVLTANATHLFVAAEGGGMYNLLPLTADGSMLPVSAIHKELGMEEDGVAKPAAPTSVALLPDGSLLTADAGREMLTNFVVEDGLLSARHRTRVHRGEGPAHLTVSPDGRSAFTAGAASGSVRRHRLVGGRALDETRLSRRWQSPLVLAAPHVQDAIGLLLV